MKFSSLNMCLMLLGLHPHYRSDVLGQFMPLVGKDWSHLGVAHLFSAIKVCSFPYMPSFSPFSFVICVVYYFLFSLNKIISVTASIKGGVLFIPSFISKMTTKTSFRKI